MKDLANVINDHGLTPAPFSDATKSNFTFLDIPTENTKNPIKVLDEYKSMNVDQISKQTKQVTESKAGLVICSNQLPLDKNPKYFQIDCPKHIFYQLMNLLYPITNEIHPSVIFKNEIHPSVIFETDNYIIGENISIGPNCIIGAEGF